MNSFGITEEMIQEILRGVSERMSYFSELRRLYDIHLSNKNLSEILGKIMEKVASDVFTRHLGYEVKKATCDRDPDLFFTHIGKPLEIKITSTDTAWTGGEFSNRASDYILVSWGGEKFDEYFLCLTMLEKSDWESHMAKKYYGPALKAITVYNKRNKQVFIGSFKFSKRGICRVERNSISTKTLAESV
jgi:hypothetical protein